MIPLVFCALTGCVGPDIHYSAKELVGEYIYGLDGPPPRDFQHEYPNYVVLYSDGTAVAVHTGTSARRTRVENARWTLSTDTVNGGREIDLLEGRTDYRLHIETHDGHIELRVSYDADLTYRKVH